MTGVKTDWLGQNEVDSLGEGLCRGLPQVTRLDRRAQCAQLPIFPKPPHGSLGMVPQQTTEEWRADLGLLHPAALDKDRVQAGVSVTANVANRDIHRMLVKCSCQGRKKGREGGKEERKPEYSEVSWANYYIIGTEDRGQRNTMQETMRMLSANPSAWETIQDKWPISANARAETYKKVGSL